MEYWLWISMLPGIGAVTSWNLIQKFKDPKTIYESNIEEVGRLCNLNRKQKESIALHRDLERAKELYDKCQRNGIGILTVNDTKYPKKAKLQKNTPILLYYKGTIKSVDKSMGIVGARRCTQEDKLFTKAYTQGHVNNGECIISGMAKGVDAYAHTACMEAGGYTIAVLACGLDICYPSEHKLLMERISEKGLLLSEYAPGVPPAQYNFPRRNRIISAWSDRLTVIAPGKGSGAFITADESRNLGREVIVYRTG